ncbi:hypothetical protein N9B31_01435 [Mariniblastus sp.]|nr:hypothetical protein [bacterium]MDA7902299.1 hypothetical protein [Mariniblastus sp.]MDA7928332.1 hypothetical protein [Mariniblastus sp.]MDB4357185.1 hypothetical protein [Mariniblastus sp.]
MICISTLLKSPVGLLIFTSLLVLSGCSHHRGVTGVDSIADVPKGAVPEPAGVKLCQWQTAQVLQAAQDQTVLYKADFLGESDKLAPSATEKILRSLQNETAGLQIWVVEATANATQDSRRVDSVTQQLNSWGVPSPRVGIGMPTALGMPGVFAESNFLNQGRSSRGNSASRTQFNGRTN